MSRPESSQQPRTEKADVLHRFLQQAVDEGDRYFKSKFIARELDLSPKEIGALMVRLRDSATDLEIEKWAYSNATTWRVDPA